MAFLLFLSVICKINLKDLQYEGAFSQCFH